MSKQKSGCSGCLKYLLFIILFIFVCSAIVEMDIGGTGGGNTSVNSTVSGSTVTPTPTPTPSPAAIDGYYYRQLNDSEKMFYEGMLKAVQNGGTSCTFENVNYDATYKMVPRAALAFSFDHPEYFWINSGTTTSGQYGYGSGHDTLTIDLHCYAYHTYTMRPDTYKDALMKKVVQVANQAGTYTTAFEQIKYVHDYLVQNTIYDYDALAEAKKTHHAANSEYIYSAYGCLINGRAVCAGYAKAFQLIMSELGYDCIYVVGDGGGPHAWNILTVEGKTYYMDVTWDDKDHKNDSGALIYPHDADYNYFCITTQQLNHDHTVDTSSFSVPLCTATDYNYYNKSGLLLKEYSRSIYANAIAAQNGQEIFSVQFTNQSAYQKAKKDILDNHYWSDLPTFAGKKSIRYNANDDLMIMTLYK